MDKSKAARFWLTLYIHMSYAKLVWKCRLA